MDNCKTQFINVCKLCCSILHIVFKYYEDIRFNDDVDDGAVADDMRLSCFEIESVLHVNITDAG